MVPATVASIAGDRDVELVWQNELGHTTYRVGTGDSRVFLKWVPHVAVGGLAAERARLEWAAQHLVVPVVLDHGSDDEAEWMVTAGIPGENAVADRWKARPDVAVREIGRGLRFLHDTLPVDACPFSWSVADRLARVRSRTDWASKRWADEHRDLGVERAVELAHQTPPIDVLVVCHGDACAPNTIIGDEGRWTGHVDLGQLGVADRWADLAVATWSLGWNYGPGWDTAFFDAYGVEPDGDRIAYYRLLWEVAD